MVEAMRTHPTHAGVQQEGCGALLTLSLSIDAAGQISSQASVSLKANTAAREGSKGMSKRRDASLAASAPAGPEPAPVATSITRPSATMDSTSAPAPTLTNNPKAIAEAGGIDAVVAAMRLHPAEPDVQRNGCLALANLAANNHDNRRLISAAGGVASVLHAMRMHQTPSVQKDGCRALMNLAADDDLVIKAIVQAGITLPHNKATFCYPPDPGARRFFWLSFSRTFTCSRASSRVHILSSHLSRPFFLPLSR